LIETEPVSSSAAPDAMHMLRQHQDHIDLQEAVFSDPPENLGQRADVLDRGPLVAAVGPVTVERTIASATGELR
jgi:hypothetical protein